MDFELNDMQKAVRDEARDLAKRGIAARASYHDEMREFPYENMRELAHHGFLGMTVPKLYGGQASDFLSYIVAIEEISQACASTGVIMAVHNSLACAAIAHFGTEKQRKRFLPELARGERIGAYSLSEQQAGSDAGNVQLSAVRDGDEYILNGHKIYVTNGAAAGLVIVFARTDPDAGNKGISAFIVETEQLGFRVATVMRTLGVCAAGVAELAFKNVRIPEENLLGEEGQGYKQALILLDGGRVGIAAQAVGIAQAAYDAALLYAQERHQFGHPISDFQAIQWMLAEMATEIEAARLLTYRAVADYMLGRRITKEAAMAKYFASRTAVAVTDRAVQIHGGAGYMLDFPIQRYYRDARVTEIYEGTSEIQRLVIASQILRKGK